MTPGIPVTFRDVVDPIARFIAWSQSKVKERVWLEALSFNWNVAADARRYGVTPHIYDARMEQLFRDGTGYIVERMVYWARLQRQRWTEQALERVHSYASARSLPADQLKIPMIGHGAGNDSLVFTQAGFSINYFDVPGSQTYAFAGFGQVSEDLHSPMSTRSACFWRTANPAAERHDDGALSLLFCQGILF
jgi:hypothetical protein